MVSSIRSPAFYGAQSDGGQTGRHNKKVSAALVQHKVTVCDNFFLVWNEHMIILPFYTLVHAMHVPSSFTTTFLDGATNQRHQILYSTLKV